MGNRIDAQFYYISGDQAYQDGITEDEYLRIVIPTRATSGSAGYDFVSIRDVIIAPGYFAKVPTGIRCEIEQGFKLDMHIRSSIGIKQGVRLSNCTGIVDSDYFFAENEGHIWLFLKNDSENTFVLRAGERIAQGILTPYYITRDDESKGKRIGGMGSTGR